MLAEIDREQFIGVCGDAILMWKDLGKKADGLSQAEAKVTYGKRVVGCVIMLELCLASRAETVTVSSTDFELVLNVWKGSG